MQPKAYTLPVSIGPGSKVGVAALSGPVNPKNLALGKEALRSLGFDVRFANNVKSCCGFLAGTDDERLAAFHALLETDVEAVVFARGGHGVLRILDRIDWRLVGARSRWFVGYSDVTPFLLESMRRTGRMAVHGPMVATDFYRPMSSSENLTFLTALSGDYASSFPVRSAKLDVPRPAVKGPIIGGCLAMLCATLGTFASPSVLFPDAIVFLEDVGESPYKIDRFLTQLGLAGLGRAQSVVFGHCHSEHPSADPVSEENQRLGAVLPATMIEVFCDHEERLGIPFYHGLNVGHGVPNLSLPLGALGSIKDGELFVSFAVDPEERS